MDGGACRAQRGTIEIVASVAAQCVCLVGAGCPSSIVSRAESTGVVDGKIGIDAGHVDGGTITGDDLSNRKTCTVNTSTVVQIVSTNA